MPVTTASQDIGNCDCCGFSWSLKVRAAKPSLASIDPDQHGERCPFCNSNRVRITQEDGEQTLTV